MSHTGFESPVCDKLRTATQEHHGDIVEIQERGILAECEADVARRPAPATES